MTRYGIQHAHPDGSTFLEDETFDTLEEAMFAACEWHRCPAAPPDVRVVELEVAIVCEVASVIPEDWLKQCRADRAEREAEESQPFTLEPKPARRSAAR